MKSFKICYNHTQLADRVGNYLKMNVFTKFSKLAMMTQSTNLGQGFPDYQPSSFVRQNIIKSTMGNTLSAQPPQGDPMLINSFKNFMQPFMNYKIKSDKQIAISHGATQSLAGAIQALVNQGDEVIIIDPSFGIRINMILDIYRPQVEFCGGKCRGVHLRPKKSNTKKDMMNRSPNFKFQRWDDDWELDWKEFSQALNDRTKAIIINSPHNPTGKIFTKEEINEMANALDKYPNVYIISDEAYSHICFDPYKPFMYPRAIEHPKLMDRTVSIFSIGKLFSSSGLRLGASVGNEQIINAITVANQADLAFLNSPFQQGAALSFDVCANSDYFQNKSNEYFGKAQDLVQMLTQSDINLGLWMPEGGYFAMSDISQVQIPEKYYFDPDSGNRISKDSAFVYWLAESKKIVAIPLESFYAPELSYENQQYVRWAFCKDTVTLNNASQRLQV